MGAVRCTVMGIVMIALDVILTGTLTMPSFGEPSKEAWSRHDGEVDLADCEI